MTKPTDRTNERTERDGEPELDAETINDLELPIARADEVVGASGGWACREKP